MSIAITAERLVRETMIERGVKKPEARKIVACEMGLPPGALQRLLENRLVHIDRIATRLNAYVVRRLEQKIFQLESELATARVIAARPDEDRIFAAQTALDEAKRLIRG